MPTFAIHTLGCRANQSDSERLSEILHSAGWSEVPFGQPSDVQIVNTCTVTREADRKSAQVVRRAQRLAPESGQVVATGCGVAARGGLKGVGSVLRLPPEQRDDILALLGAEHCPSAQRLEQGRLGQRRARALVRIQEGCDQFCTFCIVPYVRGRSRSYPVARIVEQVSELAAQGYCEIVLTGIHLSAWGHDLAEPQRLDHLLSELLRAVPRVRFRLGSVEPDLFPREIFTLMESHGDRLCGHLHLVLQHASDAILERMHRGYDLAHYQSLVEEFFARVPGACLTSDVMVGFPGETEGDFQRLLDYVRATPYYHLHVFPYSPRPGTSAAKFPDPIPPEVRNARRDRLLELAQRKRREFQRASVGQTRKVLIEKLSEQRGWVEGTADNYLAVKLRGGAAQIGTIVEVRLERFRREWMFAGFSPEVAG